MDEIHTSVILWTPPTQRPVPTNMKETLQVVWHALGAEHVITYPRNSEELWQTYRKDRFFRWIIPTLAFVIVFAALMAADATIGFVLMATIVATISATMVTRKGVLTPEQTALAIEWGHIRKEVRKLRAFKLLIQICVRDQILLECPQDSKYFLPCRAEITRLRGIHISVRAAARNRNYQCRHPDDTTRVKY